MPFVQLPKFFTVTNLDLHDLIFCDMTNLNAVLTKELRKLSMIECSIVVRITTSLPQLNNPLCFHHVIEGLHRYKVGLRRYHIFNRIARSCVSQFTFGKTQYIDHQSTIVKGNEQDGHRRYKAYDSGSIASCPFDIATFEAIYRDALALMKLWRGKDGAGKAEEIFRAYEYFPRFLELAGDELVQEMKKTEIYT